MADSQRKTANLFNVTIERGTFNPSGELISSTTRLATDYIGEMISPNVYYTINAVGVDDVVFEAYDSDKTYLPGSSVASWKSLPYTFSTAQSVYVRFGFRKHDNSVITTDDISNIMFNTGSTALPYEPYWKHSLRKLTTATEAVENPLYSDGTAITAYTIKGNEEHTGTPTSTNPVEVNGVGERTVNILPRPASAKTETVDDITFSLDSNGTLTINGSTGENAVYFYYDLANDFTFPTSKQQGGDAYLYYWNTFAVNSVIRFLYNNTQIDYWSILPVNRVISKFDNLENTTVNRIKVEIPANSTITNGKISLMVTNDGEQATQFEPYGYKIPISNGQQTIDIYIGDLPLLKSLDGTAVDEISNGTLTRRVDSDGSVLPTPTTTQITMPSIPTTEGANSITVDTTVQPSEFTATWTGWHDATVKEYDGSDWE